MKALLLLVLLAPVAFAAPATPIASAKTKLHSDDWCADNVDFAMRTAQRRQEGMPQAKLAGEVKSYYKTFRQQYPDLSQADMQRMVVTVYHERWTHFTAAIGASKDCAAGFTKPKPLEDPAEMPAMPSGAP